MNPTKKEMKESSIKHLYFLLKKKHILDEFENIAKHQPVFAGNLLSHQGCKELRNMGLVMYYGDASENISGYVLTEAGSELAKNINLLNEIYQ